MEPILITEEFVSRLAELDKICDQFHLSLQSACNDTLKRMNRRYTIEEFKERVKLLRKAYPRVSLTTDVIVGFPGETDEEFNITYENLEEIKFYKMHIFKYSPRKGTRAAVMPNQIDGNVKEERSRKLIELSDKNEKEYNKQYIGKEVEVLFEEDNEVEKYKLVTSIRGNSMENRVSIESPIGKALRGHRVGDRVEVKVNDDYSYYLVIKSIDKTGSEDEEIRGF